MTSHHRFSTLRRGRYIVNLAGRWFGTLLVLGWLSAAAAQPLASWPLNSTDDGTPNPVAANVVAGNFSAGPGLGPLVINANGARANGWSTGALDADDYFQISISPAAGFNLRLTGLNFDERRNFDGIRDYEVRWSKDPNFTSPTTIATVGVPDDTDPRTGDLSGLDIGVYEGETLYLRWYGYNADAIAPGNVWQIQDNSLEILGTVTACGLESAGPAVLNCLSTDPDADTDAMTINIPYTGIEPGLIVSATIVGGAALTVGGDDPAAVTDGVIEISGPDLVEGIEYLVTLTSPDCSFSFTDVIPANFCKVDCQIFPGQPIFDCLTSTDDPDLVNIFIPFAGMVPSVSINIEPNLTVLGDSPAFSSSGIIQVVGATEGVSYTVTITDGTNCITEFTVAVPAKVCTEKSNRPFINEIHYDNTGDPDVNEFVEIALPTAGPFSTFPLGSFTVVLYDGATGTPYASESLANMTLVSSSQDYQFYVWKPAEIQNGSPDGLALVFNNFVLLEFLSYEGTFTANGFPIAGDISTDIGVFEDGTDAPGLSLQRVGSCAPVITDCPDGLVWMGPIPQTEGMINTGQLLPVTLLDFTARPEAEAVRLDWATANELDNDYFAIERSADGRVFREIGIVPGRGTTATEAKYTFRDERPLTGRGYYRLRQVDFDGATEFFGPIAVDRTATGQEPIYAYPNPATDRVTLEGDLSKGSRLHLLDATGRVLRTWTLAERETRREVPLDGLAAGVYFLRLSAGDRVRVVRVVRL